MDRIIEVTGWRHDPEGSGWEQVETELGVALPADFKELTRRFVPGSFSGYLSLMRLTDGHDERPLLRTWARDRQREGENAIFAEMFAPYGVYAPDKGSGLIQWGSDVTEGEYFWLAGSSVDSDRWPVVARKEGGEPWHRFDMSTTEFVYRMLADPEFKPFTVADPPRRAFYLPYWAPWPPSPEEWEAYTSPNRES
ncbi:hypothetical protein [Plantactinospora sp. B5E13]|uniref:hypothetical protein n=1 Tax=Plantactinospora sp. B5E13 TaxID=3153758 RepID=UPI00325CE99C